MTLWRFSMLVRVERRTGIADEISRRALLKTGAMGLAGAAPISGNGRHGVTMEMS
jgi:hypothetical protein